MKATADYIQEIKRRIDECINDGFYIDAEVNSALREMKAFVLSIPVEIMKEEDIKNGGE